MYKYPRLVSKKVGKCQNRKIIEIYRQTNMFKVQQRVMFRYEGGATRPKASFLQSAKQEVSSTNRLTSRSDVICSQKIFDFLKRPVITEKATKLIEQKQYTFDVDSQLTKKQIQSIFEYYYGSSIKSIKTHRIGGRRHKPIKRVILCFSKNQEIPIFKNFVRTDPLKKEPLGG